MANKLLRNFLIFTGALILVIFVFTFIGFNYSTHVYSLETKQIENYGNYYLDSLESIKYRYDYFSNDSNMVVVKEITTLYTAFIIIVVFLAAQVLLVGSLLFGFKNKRIYVILKMFNYFFTAMIVAFVLVVLFKYINDINLVKEGLKSLTSGANYAEITEKYKVTLATKTYISFVILFLVALVAIICTFLNNSNINAIMQKVFKGKKVAESNSIKVNNQTEELD